MNTVIRDIRRIKQHYSMKFALFVYLNYKCNPALGNLYNVVPLCCLHVGVGTYGHILSVAYVSYADFVAENIYFNR